MAEKYPRDREFVRALGERVERAGRETATVAEMLVAESERTKSSDADSGLAARIRRELPRRLAAALDGGGKNGVEFHARWVALDGDATGDGTVASTLDGDPIGPKGTPTGSPLGANLGVVFEARLANYQVTTAVLVRAATVGSFPGGYAGGLPGAAAAMLEHTPAAFVFAFPVDGGLKVVPANAIAAVANDGKPLPDDFPGRLYARSAGRFFEELVECFVGDHRLVADAGDSGRRESARGRIEAFGREFGLEHVLYVGVETDQPEHNLITDFE
jgi:hypothetical protein